MSELIFCCPECLAIESAGAVVDDRSVWRAAQAKVAVTCAACSHSSRIAVADFLCSETFLPNGRFMPLDCAA